MIKEVFVKLLVLGSGGREHALAWRAAQEIGYENVGIHPGNAGSVTQGFFRLPTTSTDSTSIASAAKAAGVTLILIGPEAFLANNTAVDLRKAGFLVVGPGADGAQLETSKVFAKEIMQRANIPTASFDIATTAEMLRAKTTTFPCALKYDGLAAGKGVLIAKQLSDVDDFARRIWVEKEFGPHPTRVLIESFLTGKEVSLIGFCDGTVFRPLQTATDYKRVFDADEGPNTGGMGSISPSPWEYPGLEERVQTEIAIPLLAQLRKEGIDYRGILYVGLMIDSQKRPFVVEFNARFGDPETQTLMMRIQSGFVAHLLATAKGELAGAPPLQWSPQASVYVVAAAENYPASPRTGDTIAGLPPKSSSTQVFYSGVKIERGTWKTDGGRVLGVGALGTTLSEARDSAYSALKTIHWRGMHYRHDIGQ
jgi:phosphoribosylamine---glycine ligase